MEGSDWIELVKNYARVTYKTKFKMNMKIYILYKNYKILVRLKGSPNEERRREIYLSIKSLSSNNSRKRK